MSDTPDRLAERASRHARDIVLVVALDDGRIVDANAAAARAYGYTHEELLELHIFDLRRGDPSTVLEQMKAADTTGVLFETLHTRRDGTEFPVEVSSRGETIDETRYLFSIIRDITDRKRLEVEREALMTATQRALAVRDEFLVVASHELRTPVTNISLQLQNLLRLIDRRAIRAHLAILAEAALGELARLNLLIGALLDAQAASNPLALEPAELDLSDLLRTVSERLRVRAEQAGSAVIVDVPSIRGHWDPLRLDQVFTNLVLNGLKYGRNRPIRITGEEDDLHVHVEIRDEGIGIARDDAERIFGKFERAVPAGYGGLGLGLYIARQIVEAHGGRISVHSDPDVGSTFRVTLPRDTAHLAPRGPLHAA